MIALYLSGCGGSSGITPEAEPVQPLIEPTEQDDDPSVDPEQDILPRADIRELDQLYPYRSDSPYAAVLKGCALAQSTTDACTLNTLPFITQATPQFDRDDILDRLLVTHDWMGERFEQLLSEAPADMIPLFGSITAISIGSTIRPSNYWTGTGAIQLDPANLWLSVEEKANVSTVKDYRSGNGDDLTFWAFGTLRDGDRPATYGYSLTDRRERNLPDIRISMYRLLYHELAHAVDFLPNASVATLNSERTPYRALSANREFYLSPQLYRDLPLHSSILHNLAGVSFHGNDATDAQKTFSSAFVGAEMANDGAARYYGYSTVREDFATLFATTMLKMNFGLDYYVAYVQKPAGATDTADIPCSDLLVGWGNKNRIADPLVKPRARWVLESVYGASEEIDLLFTRDIGQRELMAAGVDWCTNRDGGVQADLSAQGRSRTDQQQQRLQLELERLDYRH